MKRKLHKSTHSELIMFAMTHYILKIVYDMLEKIYDKIFATSKHFAI